MPPTFFSHERVCLLMQLCVEQKYSPGAHVWHLAFLTKNTQLYYEHMQTIILATYAPSNISYSVYLLCKEVCNISNHKASWKYDPFNLQNAQVLNLIFPSIEWDSLYQKIKTTWPLTSFEMILWFHINILDSVSCRLQKIRWKAFRCYTDNICLIFTTFHPHLRPATQRSF